MKNREIKFASLGAAVASGEWFSSSDVPTNLIAALFFGTRRVIEKRLDSLVESGVLEQQGNSYRCVQEPVKEYS